MGNIKEKIDMLLHNPGLFFKRITSRTKNNLREIPHEGRVLFEIGNGVRFEADYSMEHRQMISDMVKLRYEIDATYAMEQYLKPGDVFVDVGANIGYMSAKALSLVGTSGEVHSFEPVDKYFDLLSKIKILNPSHKLFPNKIALGETVGKNSFYINQGGNFGSNSFIKEHDNIKEITVPINTFDNYLENHDIAEKVSMIKIDSEGYEFFVIKGMKGFLDAGYRPVFIMEITPKFYSMLGYKAIDIVKFLNGFGYYPYDLRTRKKLGKNFILGLKKQVNMLFIAD